MLKQFFEKYKSLPIQVKASFWFLICSFLQRGISIITTPIFTRLLSTEEYGQYSVFNSWLGIVTVFVSLNLYAGVYTQGLIKHTDERKKYSSSLQGLTLVLVIFWTILYLLFQDFWNMLFSLTTVQMLAMLLMIWTSSVFNFWATSQRVEYRYRTLVIITLVVSVLKPVIGIVLVNISEDKVTARILGLAIVELFVYTFFFFLQMYQGKTFYSKKFWRDALVFSIPLVPHYLSQNLLSSADRIMISEMINADTAGIYSLAYSISMIMLLFNAALSQTMGPWIYTKIKEKKIEDISKIAYPALILIACINILLIAFAPEIVLLFAPRSYYDAIWVIPPIAMSVYFMFMYDLFAKFEFFYEKTYYITIATISGAILNIMLNYYFIDIFGFYAAGYTTLICYVVYALLHYHFMMKICKKYLNNVLPYDTRKILFLSVSFMLCGFLFLLTYSHLIVRYMLIIILFLISVLKRKRILKYFKQILVVKK